MQSLPLRKQNRTDMKQAIQLLTACCIILFSSSINAQSWSLTGNAGTNANNNFIGTTDKTAFTIRTNNSDRIRVLSNGKVGINNDKPAFKLDVKGYINTDADSGYCIGGVPLFQYRFGSNLILGQNAGHDLQPSTHDNITLGNDALFLNESGSGNVAIGSFTMASLDYVSNNNTAVGTEAMYAPQAGTANSAFGASALGGLTDGIDNTAIGANAMITSGANGLTGATAVGYNTLPKLMYGDYSTAIGYGSLSSLQAGQNNTALGYMADVSDSVGFSNGTALGSQSLIAASNQVRIGNSSVTSIGGYADWTNISDGRVKKNIKENVPGLAFINKLQPITYNLDLDAADKIIQRPQLKDATGKIIQPSQDELAARQTKEKIIYTGFIAQDVETAAQSLNYDFSGVDAAKNNKDLYGLRYSDFVVPLVKGEQELSAQNDSLRAEIAQLKAMVTQLASRLNQSINSVKLSSASLEQNVPNPFESSTTIAYTLPQNYSKAQLIITDKTGKTLKAIALSGNGKGSVNIDATSLSAGIYSYSMLVDGNLDGTKQMVLAK